MSPSKLIDFTRFYALEIAAGKYPFVDFDAETRWHRRLYRDQRIDVWLISWLPEQGTTLHDHGGSSGAFTVLSGRLTEAVFTGGSLVDIEHPAEHSVGFGPRYVHDVRNLGSLPAVSVHAYSRPLTSMTYYDLTGGELVAVVDVATEDPEPMLDLSAAS
jgi:predicted metal-dependent enzyme (double-stranded beta helix superfamily)